MNKCEWDELAWLYNKKTLTPEQEAREQDLELRSLDDLDSWEFARELWDENYKSRERSWATNAGSNDTA